MVALQTTEAVVPGSNPSSLTVENSEDRQSHCVYCKISGQRERPTIKPKKKKSFYANQGFRAGAAQSWGIWLALEPTLWPGLESTVNICLIIHANYMELNLIFKFFKRQHIEKLEMKLEPD